MNPIAKSIVIRTSAEWFLCMVNSLCCLCTSVTLLLTAMCSGVAALIISHRLAFLDCHAKHREVNTEKI